MDGGAGTGPLVERLARAGCVAPDEEADELVAAAAGEPGRLEEMVQRRVAGEPLAWVTGSLIFAGAHLRLAPGVYVPRLQSETTAGVAAEVLPPTGRAVDLCTGSGAVAAVLQRARPSARVLATDIDPAACRCARSNGVPVVQTDLDAALAPSLDGTVDVLTAVAPYVPTRMIEYLPRDFRDHEPRLALDGGEDGLHLVRRVVVAAAHLLRPGGSLVVEVGGRQDVALLPYLRSHGFTAPPVTFYDEDGDQRALRAVRD